MQHLMRRFALFTLLILLGYARTARGQDLTVQATVDETTIGTEEPVTFTLEVQGATFDDVETPDPPATQGLVLVQPVPSTQRSVTFINGRMRQSLSFRWAFRPVREGSARIEAARVTVDGETYQTEPIRLSVVQQSQRPAARNRSRRPFGPSPNAPADETPTVDAQDIFMRAVPSARTVYQNEQVAIAYQLFFREGVQIRQSRLADSWDAEGFWREDLDVENRPIPQTVIENGLRYNTITLKRAAVFPTHAGALSIDPLRIETEVFIPRRAGDPFEQFFSFRNRYDVIEVASPPVNVSARSLPSGAPPAFQGAVGSFRMSTSIDRDEVEVGEPVQLAVRLSGTGNLATMDGPAFSTPGIFERYPPQVDTDIQRDGTVIEGTKTFTYLLVPRSNGMFSLPAITFAYFDPKAGRYETLRSEPITVRVTGSPAASPTTATTAAGLPVDDIAGILTGTANWTRTYQPPLYRHWLPYAALLLPLLVLGGVMGYQRHRQRLATDVEYARSRRAHPVARKHLKQAEALLRENQPRLFYAELERAVLSFIGNRLNIAELGLTRQQLDAHLAAAGVGGETRKELLSLLEVCDQARFAPLAAERSAMEAAQERAAGLIVTLDAQIGPQAVSSFR